jgi:hypothetical protein
MSLSLKYPKFTQNIACIMREYQLWRSQYSHVGFFEAIKLIDENDKIIGLYLTTKYINEYKKFRNEEKNKINYYINSISSVILLKKINLVIGFVILQYLNYSTEFDYDNTLWGTLNSEVFGY